jgi:tRNA A-37 threonylcarbamoyl transferase component Bud32
MYGRYRLTRQIARGGMGEVWEGVAVGEAGFERRVAIKRMFGEPGEDESLARMFLDEARIASQLHHANIVSILDYGVTDGLPYQVLEYVEGADAEQLARRGREAGVPLPVELALHICAEVAHALRHAHEARDAAGVPLNIVHRDVTPSNILLSWSGDVKLADFGIALARHRKERTLAGLTKGKPAYMSPEQMTGGELDGRADLFALGCSLHALLTGHSPLAGDGRMADLLAGVELPLAPSLPEDVSALIARAVRRAKHQRFQSAAEFAAACGKLLAQRLESDARSHLGAWLARVREAGAASRRLPVQERVMPPVGVGALLELERLWEAQAGAVEARPVTAPLEAGASGTAPFAVAASDAPRTAPFAVAKPDAPVPVPTDAPIRRPRGRTPYLVAGGMGVVALLAWAWPREAPLTMPPMPVASAVAPAALPTTPERSTVDEEKPSSSGGTVASAAASPESTGDKRQPTSAVTAAAVTQPRRAEGKRLIPAQVQDRPQVRAALAVGGAAALRAEIFVNGRSMGHAPQLLDLPVGEHSVELVSPEGIRLGPKRLRLTELHTRAAPLRWMVPEKVEAPEPSEQP